MKKTIISVFAALFASAAFCNTKIVNGIGWTYEIKNGEATIGNGDDAAIPKYTFGNISIPATLGGCPVTEIGEGAFRDCESLVSVTIPKSVTAIGRHAFDGCSALTSVTIPDSVTVIGSKAFQGCRWLKSIAIPNKVTEIGMNTFAGCESLTSITIPNSVTKIGIRVFIGCISLKEIIVERGNPAYESINGCLCTKDKHTLIACPGSLTSIEIPGSVTEIGFVAFAGCMSLTSITIPNSVTKIDNGAFFRCTSLTSVTIPSSVTKIDNGAFRDCMSLKSVYVDNEDEIGRIKTLIRNSNPEIDVDKLEFKVRIRPEKETDASVVPNWAAISIGCLLGCVILVGLVVFGLYEVRGKRKGADSVETSAASRMIKLKDCFEKGLITQEEYEAKRKTILEAI